MFLHEKQHDYVGDEGMFGRGKRCRTVFSRLVRMQISIIVILAMVAVLVFGLVNVRSTKREIRETCIQTVNDFSSKVEEDVLSFADNFVRTILLNEKTLVQPLRRNASGLTMNQIADICEKLKVYRMTGEMFHSIYVYYKDLNTVASTNGVYILKSDGEEREDVKWLTGALFSERSTWKVMNDYQIHYTLSEQYASHVIARIQKYPLLSRSGEYRGMIALNLSTEKIYELCGGYNRIDDAFFLIFTQDGSLLPNSGVARAGGMSIEELLENGETVEVNGKRFAVYTKMGKSGFRYAYLIPTSTYYERVWTLAGIALIFLLIAIAAPVMVSVSMLRQIYAPITSVAQRSREVSDALFSNRPRPEDETVISSTLNLLTEKVDSLRNEISSTESDRRALFLHLLFSAKGLERKRIDQYVEKARISLPFPYYVCAVFQFREGADMDGEEMNRIFEHLALFARERIGRDGRVLYSTTVFPGLCLLINRPAGGVENQICDALHEYVASVGNMHLVSAISEETDDVVRVNERFRGVCCAMAYRFLLPERERFWEGEAADWEQNGFESSVQQKDALERAMKNGNEAESMRILDALQKSMQCKVYAVDSIKGEIGAVQRILDHMYDALISVSGSSRTEDLPALRAMGARDLPQAFVILKDALHRFFELRATLIKPMTQNAMASGILAYIDERVNAFDIDAVSLANVATHFEKHPNYLSTSFPVWTGINFKEYVSGKRLDKAAQELRKSGAVVGAVANSLGYYNVSNFIRVFKERFHMTPGQYHEQAMAEERERQVDSPEK